MSEREVGTIPGDRLTDQVNVVYGPNASAADVPHIDKGMRQMAYQLQSWVNNMRAVTGQSGLFDRGKYVSNDNVYNQMLTARAAVKDDDICASVAELTEGMAFQGMKWESSDWDTTDLFNQMAAEQDIDSLIRKMWREEFTYSQSVCAFWWDEGEFVVRGSTDKGNKKKRRVKVWYPRAVTLLDAVKIVPVGLLAFGQERLAWKATRQESIAYSAIVNGDLQDELMERFYTGQYIPRDGDEMQELTSLQIDVSQLLLLDDRYVARHCITKPDFERFPDVRLKSVFRLLDLKQQLMEADRVNLIGAANYILLVKKGDKDDPAYPEEIANLKENYCLDEAAEVFTRRGWLTCDEVQVGDTALSLNPETGLSEWAEVEDVFVGDSGSHEVVRMEGASHHSISTPTHRWLTYDDRGKLRFKTTETLNTNDHIPYSAPRGDAPLVGELSDEMVELVAWWYTEGNVKRSLSGQPHAGGSISQSVRANPENVERIRHCLTKLYGSPGPLQRSSAMTAEAVAHARLLRDQGLSRIEAGRITGLSAGAIQGWETGGVTPGVALWAETLRPDGVVIFRLSVAVVADLWIHAPEWEKVPQLEFLLRLTVDQLNLFIDVSMEADRAGHCFAQKDARRSEAFQMAAILAGRSVSTQKAPKGMGGMVSIMQAQVFQPVAASRKAIGRFEIVRERYEGRVWCPTVAGNHTWLARSKGKVFFTGNSTLAKLPVIFSDHRLNIEIITPKTDHVLDPDKYEVLDNRIAARLLNTLNVAGARSGQRTDNSLTMSRPVARSMEGRRHMIRRFLEKQIGKAVVEHPKNAGIFMEGTPSLAFTPPNIQLDADPGTVQVLMQARTMGDLSRESFLDYFGFDQEVEAMRVTLEASKYDDIFKTRVPFDSPGNNDSRAASGGAGGASQPGSGTGTSPSAQGGAGVRGGRPAGGGKSKQSPTVKQGTS